MQLYNQSKYVCGCTITCSFCIEQQQHGSVHVHLAFSMYEFSYSLGIAFLLSKYTYVWIADMKVYVCTNYIIFHLVSIVAVVVSTFLHVFNSFPFPSISVYTFQTQPHKYSQTQSRSHASMHIYTCTFIII